MVKSEKQVAKSEGQMVINMQNSKIKILFAMLIMLGLLRSAFAATAHVDRNHVSLNETFVLTITVENISLSGSPDLESLEGDFTLLGTSQSTSMNIFNGTSSRKTEWTTTLAPKKTGTFTIPSVEVGGEKTNPLTIIVSKAPKVTSTQKNEIFFEVEIDRRQGYVQQQFVYTIKRYASRQFGIQAFSHVGAEDFKDDRLIVKQIGDTNRYMSNLGGTQYDVAELKYLVFPQQVGKISLPAPHMIAVVETGRRNRYDPFARRQQKQVQIRGEDVELNISPIPNIYISNWWLPAKKVSISQQWSSDPQKMGKGQAKVGEPITRTITLVAQGLSAEQLPELPQINIVNARAYPDKVERETRFNGTDVVGKSINKMLIIPSGAGEVKIPETKITWWDVVENRQREAVLPAQTIEVAAVAQQALTPKPPVKDIAVAELEPQLKPAQQEVEKQVEIITKTQSRWYVEVGLLLLVIIILIAWIVDHLRLKRKLIRPRAEDKGVQQKQKEKQLRKELKQACQTADAKTVRQSILAWGSVAVEDKTSVTLLDIEQHFNDTTLTNEISRLENTLYGDGLYGNGEPGWNGANLWLALESVIQSQSQKGTDRSSELEELHRI